MYNDDIFFFAKNEKELENLIQIMGIYSQDTGMEFRREKLHYANNEKWKTTQDGRNRTTKSSSNQNARSKGNLQILDDIWSWHHQANGNEQKN